jgi:hypothetical protein
MDPAQALASLSSSAVDEKRVNLLFKAQSNPSDNILKPGSRCLRGDRRRLRHKCQDNCDGCHAHRGRTQQPGQLPEPFDNDPDIDVLTEPPIPERAPTRPCAKLNRPVPAVRSAMTNAVRTPIVAPLSPSSSWMTTSNAGSAVNANSPERMGTAANPTIRRGRRPQVAARRPAQWQADDHAAAFTTFLASCRPLLHTSLPEGEKRPMYLALTHACRQAVAAGRVECVPVDGLQR